MEETLIVVEPARRWPPGNAVIVSEGMFTLGWEFEHPSAVFGSDPDYEWWAFEAQDGPVVGVSMGWIGDNVFDDPCLLVFSRYGITWCPLKRLRSVYDDERPR